MPEEKLKTSIEQTPTVEREAIVVEKESKPELEKQVQDQKNIEQEVVVQKQELQADAPQPVQIPVKPPGMQEIEGILAQDLTDLYLSMPHEKQQAFKIAGEEIAIKIISMMETGKIKIHKILVLIRNWLRIIPGVNKFFLEQEAKIKVDQIMDFAKTYTKKDDSSLSV